MATDTIMSTNEPRREAIAKWKAVVAEYRSASRPQFQTPPRCYVNAVTQTPTSRVAPSGPTNDPATGGTDSGSLATATAM